MAITFEHVKGVGINAEYNVHKDGEHVATMYRYSVRSGWEISSVHGLTLAGNYKTLDFAKQAAQTIEYPSALEVYERKCAMIEPRRRRKLEAMHGPEFIRLARELVGGSNSARVEMERLIAEIDARVVDRTDTHTAFWEPSAIERREANGVSRYRNDSEPPFYPELPETMQKESAA